MYLEVSTSPRSTWVWAENVDEAEQLRGLLGAAGCEVYPASGRNAEPRVLDLEIGYVAGEGIAALHSAGYRFLWHPSQYVLNRGATILGFPVDDYPEQ